MNELDMKQIGNQIAALRKAKGLTQAQLGERLGISFQAVSNWENGKTLPDVAVLLDLAHVLETSADNILTGGQKMIHYRGKITVSDMREGILCLERLGKLISKLFAASPPACDRSAPPSRALYRPSVPRPQ